MHKALVLLLAMTVFTPSFAAEDKKEGGKDAVKGGAPGTNTDKLLLIAPLTDADGKLTAYAYISFRLTMTSEAYALAVVEKIPFLQDAFVRDVNAATVSAAGDDTRHVDVAGVETRLLADATRVVGPGKLKLATVCTVESSDLRPAQPLRAPTTAPPVADQHGNPLKSRCES